MSAHTDRQKLQRDCKGLCEKQGKKIINTTNTIKLVCMKSQSVTTADKWGERKSQKQSEEAVLFPRVGRSPWWRRNFDISFLHWEMEINSDGGGGVTSH